MRIRENPAAGTAGPLGLSCVKADNQKINPAPPANQAQFAADRRAVKSTDKVARARRELSLEFLHECAGGIQIHAALVQTFAEIGDTAGTCYALRRLFAHVKAAHPVYVELRDEHREVGP